MPSEVPIHVNGCRVRLRGEGRLCLPLPKDAVWPIRGNKRCPSVGACGICLPEAGAKREEHQTSRLGVLLGVLHWSMMLPVGTGAAELGLLTLPWDALVFS